MSETLHHTTPHCPNCGAPRTENFCGACGQNSRSYLRATREIVADVLSETLDLDSRLGRTLRFLLLRPGYLSREFASERRASYVSPARLYIFVSLVFFGVLSLVTRFEPDVEPNVPPQAQHDIAADPDMTQMYQQLSDSQRARLRAILEKQGAATEAVRRQLAELDAANNTAPAASVSAFESALSDRLLDLAENPRGAYETVISDLPVAMFLALPLYAAWLKLMYRRRFYSEHLVFALHLHAFLFFIGTFILILPDTASASSSQAVRVLTRAGVFASDTLKCVGLAYYLLALKAFYLESWRRTAVKFVVINIAHAMLIALGVLVVTAGALVLY
jgi:hypothetical protein